jgi:hypothetical protein
MEERKRDRERRTTYKNSSQVRENSIENNNNPKNKNKNKK